MAELGHMQWNLICTASASAWRQISVAEINVHVTDHTNCSVHDMQKCVFGSGLILARKLTTSQFPEFLNLHFNREHSSTFAYLYRQIFFLSQLPCMELYMS